MTSGSMPGQLVSVALIGLAYYVGAWLGVTQTITPEGIAILWPPNAILLSAYLILPYRRWPLVALVTLVAECVADIPAFPAWAAVSFALINNLETLLAASLIRFTIGDRFDFDSLRNGGYFLLYGPLLSSSLAGLLGAGVYLILGRTDTGFLSLWRLWWFGDALGLLLLTPVIVVMWRWLDHGLPQINWKQVLEAVVLWLLVATVGVYTFPQGEHGALGFHLTPSVLLPFGAWAAVRFGVRGSAMTVLIIAAVAVAFMVRGMHPYSGIAPQYAVWLMQEYLVVVALLSIGLAVLLHEIRQQREGLELRVLERTSELESANRQLSKLATTDYLTGIANRRHFHHLATRALKRRFGGAEPASLLMLDLDHFKRINDAYGHEMGDRVINCVVERVQETIRPFDLFCRFGGEEFVLMLLDADLPTALEIAERIRRRVEQAPCESEGKAIPITVSLGVAAWDGEQNLDSLIKEADAALYKAKEAGRNRVIPTQGAGVA